MIQKPIFLPILIVLCLYGQAIAQEIGQIKKLKGTVYVERAGKSIASTAGMKLMIADTVKTGPDGAVGITLTDDTLLSAGPGTILSCPNMPSIPQPTRVSLTPPCAEEQFQWFQASWLNSHKLQCG
jgi:hypothetical protein